MAEENQSVNGSNYTAQTNDISNLLAGFYILENHVQMVTFTFGIVGNLLNLMVLFTRLRQPQGSHGANSGSGSAGSSAAGDGSGKRNAIYLLFCMSAFDLLLLLLQVPTFFLRYISEKAFLYHECFLRYYGTNVALTTVALLSTAVTLDRFAAARNVRPLRKFFAGYTGMLVALIILFSVGLCAPNLFHYRLELHDERGDYHCEATYFYQETRKSTNIIISFTNSIIPMSLMVIFGGATYRALRQKGDYIKRLNDPKRGGNKQQSQSDKISFATHMVLATIFIFSVCSTISLFIITCVLATNFAFLDTSFGFAIVRVNNFINFVRSSINFIFYCSTSAEYRRSLVSICSCNRKCKQKAADSGSIPVPVSVPVPLSVSSQAAKANQNQHSSNSTIAFATADQADVPLNSEN